MTLKPELYTHDTSSTLCAKPHSCKLKPFNKTCPFWLEFNIHIYIHIYPYIYPHMYISQVKYPWC